MPHSYEAERLEVLRALEILDTPPEAEFDVIVEAAKRLTGCKTALVSLVDADRQWFKARCGLDASETGRDVAFCAHAVAADDALIVPDATQDARFADNPLVTGAPYIRFYMGMPIRASLASGGKRYPLGTLCVVDDAPMQPSDDQVAMLLALAQLVEALLAMRTISRNSLKTALGRQDALIQMNRKQRQLTQAERMAQVGSWRLDLATRHVEWSDQVYAIYGLAPGDGEALKTALEFYPLPDREILGAALARCIKSGESYDLELDFIDVAGDRRRVRAMAEPEEIDGHRTAVIGVFQDITERHRMEQSLLASAQTDDLTRIASRRGFNHHLDAAIEVASFEKTPLAVALIDLDRFKEVNDRLGHAAGDEVLRVMALKMRNASYLTNSFAARLGGDEFVLLLRGADALEQLDHVLAQLLADLRHALGPAGRPMTVSATIGVCHLDPRHDTRSLLLQGADEALYRAKAFERGTAAVAGRSGFISAGAMLDPVRLVSSA